MKYSSRQLTFGQLTKYLLYHAGIDEAEKGGRQSIK